MKSKNIFFLLLYAWSIVFSNSITGDYDTKLGRQQSDFEYGSDNLEGIYSSKSSWLPFETWSPLTSVSSWGARAILNNAVPSNELTYSVGAGVIALGWILYRWAYLKRPSWVSIVPDWLRRFSSGVLYTFGITSFTGDAELLREQLGDNEARVKSLRTSLNKKNNAQNQYHQPPYNPQQQQIINQYN